MPADPLREAAEEIERAFDAHGRDLEAFPAIATRTLEGLEGVPRPTLTDLCRSMADGGLDAQDAPYFSDLPLTVYHRPDWRLELLLWNDASTDVHGHGFRGAFRVLRGGSLHARWALQEDEVYEPMLALGSAIREPLEILREGDVRTITPGLVHSLFHLERPSITLVARTHMEADVPAQVMFMPPALILRNARLVQLPHVRAYERALTLALQLDEPQAIDAWIEGLHTLRTSDAVHVCMRVAPVLERIGRLEAAMEALRSRHGDALVDAVDRGVRRAQVDHELRDMRAATHEPEARLLLALLMNCHDRAELMRALDALRPGVEPTAWIEACLRTLGDPDALMDVVLAAHQGAAPDRGVPELARRFVRALQRAPEAERDGILAAVAAGRTPQGDGDAPDAGAHSAAGREALASLWAEPALHALRNAACDA